MVWLLLLLLGFAEAAEQRPVRPGDTVESLAASLGDPGLVGAIRELNGLAPGAQPTVGTVLTLPPAGDGRDQRAFLISATGDVTVRGQPGPAQTFEPLPVGGTVCTGPESYATVRVATQCAVQGSDLDDIVLSGETCLTVESAFSSTFGRSTVVRISEGSIQVAESRGAPGSVTVRTESGLTTGSGGGYRVSVEDAAMRTEALYAEVAVQGAGEEVVLDAGQGSRVRSGQVPGEPVDLLVTEQLLRPSVGAPLVRPVFTWTHDASALGYRLEIAANRVFTDLVYQHDVPGPEHRPTLLQLPSAAGLWWRVAPFDGLGFLGVPTEPRRMALPAGVRP